MRLQWIGAFGGALALLLGCGCNEHTATPASATPPASATSMPPTATPTVPSEPHPNIVFIIMDDVGIDQLAAFGLGKGNLASTPNLDALAGTGIKFTNVWVMPECSPSRASFFTGRYPVHTGVTSALIPNMLPQAQVSPYETAIPRVLAAAGYTNAIVGKYHLGSQNPAHNCAPKTLGWDHFSGNMEAGPPAIDTQAGHAETDAPADLICGYDQRPGSGACFFYDAARCGGASPPCCRADTVLVPGGDGSAVSRPVDGRSCVEAGGLFVAGAPACQPASPVSCRNMHECIAVADGTVVLDFSQYNGYYVWPDTLLNGVLPPDSTDFSAPECGEPPSNREYMTIAQNRAGIDWYNRQPGPRMLTVSYNAIHTPYQQAASTLVAAPGDDLLQCGDSVADRLLGNNMLEAMDAEIGQLLRAIGLAALDARGVIQTAADSTGHLQIPELQRNNAVVIVIGDNGTLGFSVKQPFDANRSKGTVYQTGVWVPLIVAGSGVQGATGRSVDALVNGADLYELFAELAGLNVREIVPPAHPLDSQPMLAYLTNPAHPSIRAYNFTELGAAAFEQPQNNATRSWPCLVNGTTCSDILFDTEQFCRTNKGIWWGPSEHPDSSVVAAVGAAAAAQGLGSCCAVKQAVSDPAMVTILPVRQFGVRNQTYKLLKRSFPACEDPAYDLDAFPPRLTTDVFEFYDLTVQPETNPVGLDATDLACDPNGSADCFTDTTLKQNFMALQAEMERVLNTAVSCPGDGNLDQRVDQRDAQGVRDFTTAGQSFFDFNGDAKTDQADMAIVTAHLGSDCLGTCRRSDLNHDGVVTAADVAIAELSIGPCELCAADVNGDGVVDAVDAQIVEGAIGCLP